ncbi:hypothetical protein LTR05_000672 [Lithohypha guttulata]|uniref:Telomere-associated protein Rif1 N-terminal domain-containing protein n=1 Tax=Lithohypha guttulata TaxID=1690604 RepID=A0AAN7T6R0_9EURO|nr:hypothetical protein LTR05_000672 [Lithohypha guttulata]
MPLFTNVDGGNDSTDETTTDQPGLEAVDSVTKKVGFYPYTTNISEKALSTPESEVAPTSKPLSRSRDRHLKSRPILKPRPSQERVADILVQYERRALLDDMDSLFTNLASGDRAAVIDAYQTFLVLVKSYGQPPESETLRGGMQKLQQYIKKDLMVLDDNLCVSPSEERASLGNLVTSALKVLITLVWSHEYSKDLTDDFRQWFLDRSIRVLKDQNTSKAITMHYMHLLATQNFRQNINANNRHLHILEAIHEVADYASGKGIALERLLVHQKLVDQAKSVMEKRPDLWMKDLLFDMSHSSKEVRKNAICLGLEVCKAFGNVASINQTARQYLAETTGERTLSESITNRLEKLLAAQDEDSARSQIPQIWIITIMLCHGTAHKLETWPQLHEWLRLIQRCFNMNNDTVRTEAFRAWNRLYHIARPYRASEKVISMLAKPAIMQLERNNNTNAARSIRAVVVSSYCMLLYYAFRPSRSVAQYSRMWTAYVAKLMTSNFLSKSGADLPNWNENRAYDNNLIDYSELPAIDAKWIRGQIVDVLGVVRLLVEHSSFGPNGAVSEQAYVAQTWKKLMHALRDSTSKEIIMSVETKAALQAVLIFLTELPDPETTIKTATLCDARRTLLARITVDVLGAGTILQAFENDDGKRASAVLPAVFSQLTRTIDQSGIQQPAHEAQLNRCVDILGGFMAKVTNQDPALDITTLQVVNRCLDGIALEAHRYLRRLSDAIALLLKAIGESLANNELPEAQMFTCQSFCLVTRRLVEALPPTTYRYFDSLLASICSVQYTIQATHLDDIRDKFRHVGPNDFGPKLLAAVAELRTADMLQKPTFSRPLPGLLSRLKNSSVVAPDLKVPTNKPRHDDSQVQFVPIESSPSNYEDVESQLLTTRQKDVRHRQSTERPITFADIRSSPMAKMDNVHSSKLLEERSSLPNTPTTPVAAASRLHEDDEPPTPTPKAKKPWYAGLQPDVPSSPPSVVENDMRIAAASAITSSPIVHPRGGDDRIQLDTIVEVDGHTEVEEQQAKAVESSCHPQGLNEEARSLTRVPLLLDVDTADSTVDDYETAEAVITSTPTSYSDENDALAASQLSQSLVEESQSFSDSRERVLKSSKTKTKRKRSSGHDCEDVRHKKSRVLDKEEIEIRTDHVAEQPLNEEMADCIVVNTNAPGLRLKVQKARQPKRITTKGLRQESPALSQISLSPASTSSSRRSNRRREFRSDRKTRSASSQEASPTTQIRVVVPPRADTSAKDEAKTVAQSEAEDSPPTQTLSQFEAEVESTTEKQAEEDAEILSRDGRKKQKTIASENTRQEQTISTNNFDVVNDLQDILNRLNDPATSTNTSNLNIAAIHSLCFQIGLKAQQYAQQ